MSQMVESCHVGHIDGHMYRVHDALFMPLRVVRPSMVVLIVSALLVTSANRRSRASQMMHMSVR